MPKSLAICIEDTAPAPGAPRFMQCVALPGNETGIRVDKAGKILWKTDDKTGCEIWVSADDRLILFRPEGAVEVTVRRAGRTLNVPFGKPVVLIDKDEFELSGRHFRIHIHGIASGVSAPTIFEPKQSALSQFAKGAAAAVILGSVAASGGCGESPQTPETGKPPIELRDYPPVPAKEPPTPQEKNIPPEDDQSSGPISPIKDDPKNAPIEVLNNPPSLSPDPTPEKPVIYTKSK